MRMEVQTIVLFLGFTIVTMFPGSGQASSILYAFNNIVYGKQI